MFVWSQIQFGLDVKMIRRDDDKTLWRAQHITERSGGGLPLSLFGIVTEAYKSVKISSDTDCSFYG